MAAAGLHLTVPCERCTKPFRQYRNDQRFCSQLCCVRAWREAKRPNATCQHCGSVFARFGVAKFCGVECRKAAESARKRVVGGPGSARPKTAPRRTCEVCGGLFYAPPVLIRRGGGRFCSVACRSSHMSRDPGSFPVGGKRGVGGKRPDLGNAYFRSRWEANYARYLNWLIEKKQIAGWTYERTTFEFVGIKRGTRFYTPDFEVTENNGLRHFDEIKGYMDARSETQMKRMTKYHPGVDVRVIGKKEYRAIAKTMAKILPNWEGTK